jgi:hypothetical protein
VFEKEDFCGKKTHVTFTRNEIEKKLGLNVGGKMRKRRVYYTRNRREEKCTQTSLENANLHALEKVMLQKNMFKIQFSRLEIKA